MVHTADLELTATQIRVLGALIEKERATPDQYPLTTNALRTACNQKTSREPVVDYSDSEVEQAMLALRDIGYARSVTGSGRTVKHKQVLDEALGLSGPEVSVLGVLMLRGAQTPNELRTRTDRLHRFDTNDAVEATLSELATREPPLVVCVGRAPGQRGARWIQLLAEDEAVTPTAAQADAGPDERSAEHERSVEPDRAAHPQPPLRPEAAAPGALAAEVAALRRDLDDLRRRFDDLASQLGVDD
ncbi:MAG: YceH family protein [Acidimicrobiia bacterium]|nr:YceH family protein [Acidimicrobiia bacterium]